MNDETFLLFIFLLFYFMLIITCCCFVVFVVIVAVVVVVVVVVTNQPTGWIQSNLPFQSMENMRQKFAVIHRYDIIWCYIVHFVYLSLWPFRSVQVSPLVVSQMECHKSLFYFVVGIFSIVSLSLSTENPCDSIQIFLPLLCLYCWMSAAAGLFQVSHIQLNPAYAALHCEPSSPAQ